MLCPVLGLLVFVFLCVGLVVGLSDVDVGLSDCRIALEMGFRSVWECFRSGRAQKPHTSPTTTARALKKIYTGRVKRKHGVWCLEREEHERVSRGCLKQNMASRREKKRESV